LLAALVVVPHGQANVIWFSLVALLGIAVLTKVGGWYRRTLDPHTKRPTAAHTQRQSPLPRRQTIFALAVLMVLIFSKYIYLVSLTNYYTFYLISRFGLSVPHAQYYLFFFLFAVAAGTIIGGPVGDRYGRKYVIWISILGVAPFTLALPYASLPWVVTLSVIIGLILASAFSAILVYAQELLPGRVGLISGLFFGFAFGVAGIGAAMLGKLADHYGIYYVFQFCSFLPLLGLLTAFLPNLEKVAADRGN
jgi:FSR family fosmidomycin resistance protein-like MFS transporter